MTMADPDILWQDDGTPRSARFGDVYFSARDGLAETRHVFLGGGGAPQVWQDARDFTLAETGFGTGLNFLATWALWRMTAAADARIHFVSAEAFPMCRDDMARALARWPELGRERDELIAAYPLRRPGVHHLVLDGGRVRLTLLFGEAAEMFAALDMEVDAWFLDGFAPSRNPDMWRPQLFRQVARLSKPGARLATFTVAGAVRRGLAEVGFGVEKRPGFGGKRECLTARFEGSQHDFPDDPWFAPPTPCRPGHVAIIGAGIAGVSAARALASRGVGVTVLDRAEEVFTEASGNPAAVVEPQVAMGGVGRALHEAAFLYARRFYDGLGLFTPCGTRHLAQGPEAADRFQKIVQDDIGPDPLFEDGGDGDLVIPRAGIVEPPKLRAALADGLDMRLGATVTGLRREESGWSVMTEDGSLEADAVVVANAVHAPALMGTQALPLRARRGQVSLVPAGSIGAPANARQVLSYGGYLTPAVRVGSDDFHVLGATFDEADPGCEAWRTVTSCSHDENRDKLRAARPDLDLPDMARWQGRTGLRATTPDRLPVAGGVVDEAAFLEAYGALRTGGKGTDFPPPPYQPGLYALTGLGSRGFATAPLLGELIAAQMTGAPAPLPRDLVAALHPARFLVRGLKRREI